MRPGAWEEIAVEVITNLEHYQVGCWEHLFMGPEVPSLDLDCVPIQYVHI